MKTIKNDNEIHLSYNSLEHRWELINKKNEVIHWGDLKTMQIIYNILNGEA